MNTDTRVAYLELRVVELGRVLEIVMLYIDEGARQHTPLRRWNSVRFFEAETDSMAGVWDVMIPIRTCFVLVGVVFLLVIVARSAKGLIGVKNILDSAFRGYQIRVRFLLCLWTKGYQRKNNLPAKGRYYPLFEDSETESRQNLETLVPKARRVLD